MTDERKEAIKEYRRRYKLEHLEEEAQYKKEYREKITTNYLQKYPVTLVASQLQNTTWRDTSNQTNVNHLL